MYDPVIDLWRKIRRADRRAETVAKSGDSVRASRAFVRLINLQRKLDRAVPTTWEGARRALIEAAHTARLIGHGECFQVADAFEAEADAISRRKALPADADLLPVRIAAELRRLEVSEEWPPAPAIEERLSKQYQAALAAKRKQVFDPANLSEESRRNIAMAQAWDRVAERFRLRLRLERIDSGKWHPPRKRVPPLPDYDGQMRAWEALLELRNLWRGRTDG